MRVIIALMGPRFAGKTTFADIAQKEYGYGADTAAERFLADSVFHPEVIHELTRQAQQVGAVLVIVGIEAPTAARHGRMAAWHASVTGAACTWEAFLAIDDSNRGSGQPWDGQQVDACMAIARKTAGGQKPIVTRFDAALVHAKASIVTLGQGHAYSSPRRGYVLQNAGDIKAYCTTIRFVLDEIELLLRST